MKKSRFLAVALIFGLLFGLFGGWPGPQPARAQADDPTSPSAPVKLIFIHHSTGENWLTDGYGDLGLTLGQNNYFVSDTNYGWGPNAIGDRTDIVNWREWFRSVDTPLYMDALYTEHEQHAGYTRTLADPGGENQIVMFKSCFPNSELDGQPNDPPTPEEGMTVGHAKYVYNDLLEYFATRPDKLFIVITAPPVQDSTYAANARAFTSWLMTDWLRAANYPYANVAVFDFYNLLTHPDNHHRYANGQIEWITSYGNNTLFYDSDGDNHPNIAGSQKATDEFIPLLNIFYHRWLASAPAQPPIPVPPPTGVAVTEPPAQPTAATGGAQPPSVLPTGPGLVTDFERDLPEEMGAWEGFWDQGTTTQVVCEPDITFSHQGQASLHYKFNVAPASWSTCSLLYTTALDWQLATGLGFYLHASQPGLAVDVVVYGGTPDERASYITSLETTNEMVDAWGYVQLTWDQFTRADWEESPGTPLVPAQVTGFALAVGASDASANIGDLWLDELTLLGDAPVVIAPPPPTDVPAPAGPGATEPVGVDPITAELTDLPPLPTEAPKSRGCPGSIGLGIAGLALALWQVSRRRWG
jgi:hypothetical protein